MTTKTVMMLQKKAMKGSRVDQVGRVLRLVWAKFGSSCDGRNGSGRRQWWQMRDSEPTNHQSID
jgi:hypothetical protein